MKLNESDSGVVQDNVAVSFYDAESLRERFSDWDGQSDSEKLSSLQGVQPATIETTHNVVTKPFRERLRQAVNPEMAETEIPTFTHVAFGDDATEPTPDDTHLKNEVYRAEIDIHTDDSSVDEFRNTMLMGSDEAVGENLIEAALVSTDSAANSDDMAANRFILDDEEERLQPKDSEWVVTFRISLTWRDVSEVFE